MTIDKRLEERYDLSFGEYEIAGALYSHGDVIKIIDCPNSPKKGIFIADTLGHCLKKGTEMRGIMADLIKD